MQLLETLLLCLRRPGKLLVCLEQAQRVGWPWGLFLPCCGQDSKERAVQEAFFMPCYSRDAEASTSPGRSVRAPYGARFLAQRFSFIAAPRLRCLPEQITHCKRAEDLFGQI